MGYYGFRGGGVAKRARRLSSSFPVVSEDLSFWVRIWDKLFPFSTHAPSPTLRQKDGRLIPALHGAPRRVFAYGGWTRCGQSSVYGGKPSGHISGRCRSCCWCLFLPIAPSTGWCACSAEIRSCESSSGRYQHLKSKLREATPETNQLPKFSETHHVTPSRKRRP